ncbi:MAG TPA: DinB family protein [Propionibacteriaceae bacterium]|nr:DinB family protein [Propionibacteriaceae bacterium]
MAETKEILARYLAQARDALTWKLEGLSEYDARRPMTPTGTNLLGLVKHAAVVQAAYLGDCMGRPFPYAPDCYGPDAGDNDDMWALPDETRTDIEELWARSCAHADATIAALPLDAEGHVPWWPAERNPVTLELLIVHLQADLSRHAGHADIVREMIDGTVGLRTDQSSLPDRDAEWWRTYVARLEDTARRAGTSNRIQGPGLL